ncbi:MAG: hypothetical protein J6W19_08655 [Prevotella sp.]|nr:hypothetical protein [Prevotella sp.]
MGTGKEKGGKFAGCEKERLFPGERTAYSRRKNGLFEEKERLILRREFRLSDSEKEWAGKKMAGKFGGKENYE